MKKQRLPFVLLITLITLSLIASTAGAAPKDGPAVSLSAAKNEFSQAEEVLVTVTISNPSGHSVRVLRWFTPMDGVEEPIFTVKVNNAPVDYTGAVYKRPAPTGSDYITLKSGESSDYVVNLGDYYDLSRTGQYKIHFYAASGNLFSEKSSNAASADFLASEAISLKIEGRAAKGKPTPPPPPPPGGNTYNACTTAQQGALVKARGNAKTYASGAKNYLSGGNPDGLRYVTWFGVFDTSRLKNVSDHFTAISNAFVSAGINFDCSCKQNYYAYVYPTRPYNIYLCRVFWVAPDTGTDSKAGTLIHEMSHFNVVASTNDYVYGQSGAMNLAVTDPGKATNNADNHEYFAENNPSLP